MFRQSAMHLLNDFSSCMHYCLHWIERFSVKFISHDMYDIYDIYHIVATVNSELWYRIFVRKLISDITWSNQNFIVKLDEICCTQYSDFDKCLVFNHAEKSMIKNFWCDMLNHLNQLINIKLCVLQKLSQITLKSLINFSDNFY